MSELLPRKFMAAICGAFGDEGARWLHRLPFLVEEIEENWSISARPPFPNLSYHYVAPCVCADGGDAVLKIGFPGDAANILCEAKMLEFLNGDAVCKLLRFDAQRFAFLLEKLNPGDNLKNIFENDNEKAVDAAIKVMRAFWRSAPQGDDFQTLDNWFRGLEKAERTSFPQSPLKKARNFFERLTETEQKTLLHGDFHHENILSAGREPFLAIDPKGIVGDTGYDIGVFLINHAKWLRSRPNLDENLKNALERFSDAFGMPPQELRKWTFAHSVLSAWWSFEENCEDWRAELAFAEIWKV